MKNLIAVRILREQLKCNSSGIEKKQPGVYRWWFEAEEAKKILAQLSLSPSECDMIARKEIEGTEYWALYFGISSDMLGRAKWHIAQEHKPSAVKHGTLSTLRNTLGALLGKNMSKSMDIVNKFMDNNCYWEWEYNDDPAVVERAELSAESGKCYPLNIKSNKTVRSEVRKKLRDLRRKHKK